MPNDYGVYQCLMPDGRETMFERWHGIAGPKKKLNYRVAAREADYLLPLIYENAKGLTHTFSILSMDGRYVTMEFRKVW
jgi:hypothetical protein